MGSDDVFLNDRNFLQYKGDGIADKKSSNYTEDSHGDRLRHDAVNAVDNLNQDPDMEKIDSEGAFGAVFNKGCDFACEVKRMADAENKGSGSGGQDIGRNETEEIAVVVLHFYAHYYGDYKADKSKDIDNMAEVLELRGFLFIVEKGLDIVGIYSTACKVDENHFIEIDREGCEMTYELIAHSSQPH